VSDLVERTDPPTPNDASAVAVSRFAARVLDRLDKTASADDVNALTVAVAGLKGEVGALAKVYGAREDREHSVVTGRTQVDLLEAESRHKLAAARWQAIQTTITNGATQGAIASLLILLGQVIARLAGLTGGTP